MHIVPAGDQDFARESHAVKLKHLIGPSSILTTQRHKQISLNRDLRRRFKEMPRAEKAKNQYNENQQYAGAQPTTKGALTH